MCKEFRPPRGAILDRIRMRNTCVAPKRLRYDWWGLAARVEGVPGKVSWEGGISWNRKREGTCRKSSTANVASHNVGTWGIEW